MSQTTVRSTLVRPDGSIFETEIHRNIALITSEPNDKAGSDGLMLWADRDNYVGRWVYPFAGFTLEIEAA